MSDPSNAVVWIEKNFWIPETRSPIPLMQYQKDCIRHILSRDENGNFPYSIIIWSDIKKSAKSTIAAAVAQWMAMTKDYAEIYIIANDLKQADSRVAHYFRRSLELNLDMRGKYRQRGYKTIFSNGSFVEAIPIDPSGEAGSNADAIFWSELWGAHQEAQQRMWTEMTLSPTKHGKSFRWVESYAGYSEESELLYSLYDLGVLQGKKVFDNDLEAFHNGSLFCLWNSVPRCPWQTKEYYCLPLSENKNDLLVLTKSGWKSAWDISTEDFLCTMGNRGFIEYQKPSRIFRDKYQGEILRLKNSKCDISMTPNHRVLGEFASHTRKVKQILSKPMKYKFMEAKDASKKQIGWIPGHGNWSHDPLDTIRVEDIFYPANDFVELMAWYLSEGTVRIDKRNNTHYPSAVQISQDRDINSDKHKRIMALCERLSIRCHSRKVGIEIYNARLARFFLKFGKSSEKRIPRYILDGCSKYQLERFLEAYILGDGTKKPTSSEAFLIYTNSDGMMLDLMELSFKCGYRPRHIGSYSSSPDTGRLPIHHISIMKSHIGWSTGNHRRHWSSEQFSGDVWCPTVPNGNFFVMQNGTCWWTGNSSEAMVLTPAEFDRMHRNKWASATEIFVPIEWWMACERPLPQPRKYEPIVLGVDAGISDDNFGIVALARHPENNEEVVVRDTASWKPPTGKKIDFLGTIEHPGPELWIREFCKKNNVVELTYDPYQLEDMAGRLRREGIVFCKAFPQGSQRLVADSELRAKIRDRRIWHNGNQDLTQHVKNANAEKDQKEDRRIRIIKRTQQLKIDLCVALSMGTHEVMRLNL